MKALIQFLTLSILFSFVAAGCKVGNTSKTSSNSSVNDSNNVIDNSVDNSVNIGEPGEDSDAAGEGADDGVNPDCSEGVNTVDGQGGFLWKAESESDGNLVVLFPAEFDVKFLSVSVFDLTGDIEEGSFAGFTNGDRQTWRFDSPGADYTGDVLVDALSQECKWEVANPEIRQD